MFPDKINTFVDLFGGGFNVGINVNADHIIYNDICEQVVGFLRYLQGSNIEEVLQKIDLYIDKYELTRGIFSLEKNTTQVSKIQLNSIRFYVMRSIIKSDSIPKVNITCLLAKIDQVLIPLLDKNL